MRSTFSRTARAARKPTWTFATRLCGLASSMGQYPYREWKSPMTDPMAARRLIGDYQTPAKATPMTHFPLQVGTLVTAKRASGVCAAGERGVCYEVHELGGRYGVKPKRKQTEVAP